MQAPTNNIEINQGSVFTIKWLVRVLTDPTQPESTGNPRVPLNLSTYSAEMQVRRNFDSSSPTLSFTSPGKLSLGSDGYVTLSLDGSESLNLPLDGSQTQNVAFQYGKWLGIYDLRITDANGATTCISQGEFIIDREVTR